MDSWKDFIGRYWKLITYLGGTDIESENTVPASAVKITANLHSNSYRVYGFDINCG